MMKKTLLAALLLSSSPLCGAVEPALAQGITIGPGGVGVDPGDRRYRGDDRDDREYSRERYRRDRDRDDDDYRPRRRHRRDDDDDQ